MTAEPFGTMTALVLICIGMFSLPPSAVADENRESRDKEPWEWSIEERVAKRFDAEDIPIREAAYRKAHAAQLRDHTSEYENPPGTLEYRIDGSRDPALFLPVELFDGLLNALSATEPAAIANRNRYHNDIADAGFNPFSFWSELDYVTRDYRELMDSPQASSVPIPRAERDSRYDNPAMEERHATGLELCRLRFEALEAARRHFGRVAFDRFLYTAVAPRAQKASASSSSAAEEIQRLRWQASGCR